MTKEEPDTADLAHAQNDQNRLSERILVGERGRKIQRWKIHIFQFLSFINKLGLFSCAGMTWKCTMVVFLVSLMSPKVFSAQLFKKANKLEQLAIRT